MVIRYDKKTSLLLVGGFAIIAVFVVAGVVYQPSERMSNYNKNSSSNLCAVAPLSTDTWNTCRIEEYGYEVKYPADWEVYIPYDDGCRLGPCKVIGSCRDLADRSIHVFSGVPYSIPASFHVFRAANVEYENINSLDEYLNTRPDLKIFPYIEEGRFRLDGEEAAFFKQEPAPLDSDRSKIKVFAFHNGKIYRIFLRNPDSAFNETVLSCFKFID
jgi:hypothetical protein